MLLIINKTVRRRNTKCFEFVFKKIFAQNSNIFVLVNSFYKACCIIIIKINNLEEDSVPVKTRKRSKAPVVNRKLAKKQRYTSFCLGQFYS